MSDDPVAHDTTLEPDPDPDPQSHPHGITPLNTHTNGAAPMEEIQHDIHHDHEQEQEQQHTETPANTLPPLPTDTQAHPATLTLPTTPSGVTTTIATTAVTPPIQTPVPYQVR